MLSPCYSSYTHTYFTNWKVVNKYGSTKVSSNLLCKQFFFIYWIGNWISKCCFAYVSWEGSRKERKFKLFPLPINLFPPPSNIFYIIEIIFYKCPDFDKFFLMWGCSSEQYGWKISIPSNRSIVNEWHGDRNEILIWTLYTISTLLNSYDFFSSRFSEKREQNWLPNFRCRHSLSLYTLDRHYRNIMSVKKGIPKLINFEAFRFPPSFI